MRGFLFILPCVVATLLAGCAGAPESQYSFQSPDLPPSRFTGDIVYPAMPQPHVPPAVPKIDSAPPEPVVPVQPAAQRIETQPAPEAPDATISPVVDTSTVSIDSVHVMNGRVTVVNLDAGVCVVNFPIGQLPPVDKTLTVYRNGIRTGQIKITGPARDDNIAADIVSGEIRTDDEARDH